MNNLPVNRTTQTVTACWLRPGATLKPTHADKHSSLRLETNRELDVMEPRRITLLPGENRQPSLDVSGQVGNCAGDILTK